MLAISVIVLAVVAAGYEFYPPLQQGIDAFMADFERWFADDSYGGPAPRGQ